MLYVDAVGIRDGEKMNSNNVFNDPRTRVFLRLDRMKVMYALIKLTKEISNTDLPGPYLSQIAREARLNKRTTMLALNAFQQANIIKSSRWIQKKIRGRPVLVKVFELKNETQELQQFIEKYMPIIQ